MAGCSTVVVIISFLLGWALIADSKAVELDSVPHEVKMISESCSQPISA